MEHATLPRPSLDEIRVVGVRAGATYACIVRKVERLADGGFKLAVELYGPQGPEDLVLTVQGLDLPPAPGDRRSRARNPNEGPFVLCPECRTRTPLHTGTGAVGSVVFACPACRTEFGPGSAR